MSVDMTVKEIQRCILYVAIYQLRKAIADATSKRPYKPHLPIKSVNQITPEKTAKASDAFSRIPKNALYFDTDIDIARNIFYGGFTHVKSNSDN